MNVNKYIKENKCKVNEKYRHTYHCMGEVGWINDPNGFSFFNGNYHLFYQHNPFDDKWGPMHWGHAITKDLVRWEYCDVALSPDEDYDRDGIFSGSAFIENDEMFLFYTGHRDKSLRESFNKINNFDYLNIESYEDDVVQVQCLAKSKDGIVFNKLKNNPIIDSKNIPKIANKNAIRDPNIFKKNGKYYMALGATKNDSYGQVLFYTSSDMINWTYLHSIDLGKDFGSVWECPDYFELDGKSFLIISPQHKEQVENNYQNIHSAIALVGKFNYETGHFKVENKIEIDNGFDFYAPQTIKDENENRIMIAWMNMWERKSILNNGEHNWNGAMTLPRQLSYKDGKLSQTPLPTIKDYFKNKKTYNDIIIEKSKVLEGISGNSINLKFDFEILEGKIFELHLLKSENEYLKIIFDKNKKVIKIDRSNCKNLIETETVKNDYIRCADINLSDKINVEILIDVSSVEIFLNSGETVLTSLFYSEEGGEGIKFFTDGKVIINKLIKNDIVL